MDLSTIIGVIAGVLVIVYGIGFKDLKNFWDLPSFIIVIGGTFTTLMACYPFSMLKNFPHHLKIIMQSKRFKNEESIEMMAEFAMDARKNGLLALEQKAEELKDEFLKFALMLIVDSHDPQDVKQILNDKLDYMVARHEAEMGIYEKGSALAPAFGMIGTLIGLINMLKGLNLAAGASDSLGENMSIALVTTMYGCLLANILFHPIAKKLSVRNEEEYLNRQLIIEGVLSIQKGDNPKFLREKLYTYLRERQNGGSIEEGDQEGKGKKKKKGKKG